TMCPSYMVTLEEEHSTRGRAHMLWEMLQGEVLREGWRDEKIKHAMDLCLSCKACKSECPTNVDIATYRSEFLSHYYESRRRPFQAYAFGMIDRWARLASIARRHLVGGYLQQLFPAEHERGRVARPASGRVPCGRAGRARLLRTAPLRFRHARRGKEIPSAGPAPAGPSPRRRMACRGAGAELRVC